MTTMESKKTVLEKIISLQNAQFQDYISIKTTFLMKPPPPPILWILATKIRITSLMEANHSELVKDWKRKTTDFLTVKKRQEFNWIDSSKHYLEEILQKY